MCDWHMLSILCFSQDDRLYGLSLHIRKSTRYILAYLFIYLYYQLVNNLNKCTSIIRSQTCAAVHLGPVNCIVHRLNVDAHASTKDTRL